MIFHAYENGFQTLGRQTLLRELVQKEDGWLHLKEGAISLPAPERLKLSGIKDFVWQTCREHNLNDRFRITPDKISIEAKGNTPKEGFPLLARTSAHKYEVEACFELKGEIHLPDWWLIMMRIIILDLVLIISRCFVIGVDK